MPKLAIISSSIDERPDLLVAPDGSDVEVARFPMRIPGFARNPYDRFIVALGYIDAAERAMAEGCDAIFIDTFADYGMAEIRSAVPVPVIGAGESGIAAASADGTRDFSIVTVWPPSMNYLYKERLDNSPGGSRCRRVEHVMPETELQNAGSDAFVKSRMIRHETDLIDLLAARVQQVADEDGVGTILLGCTCMAPIGPQIQERVDVEVVEGTRNGLAVAFATIAARPAGEFNVSPRRGTMPLIVDAWLEHGVVPEYRIDECETCVSLASEAEIAASIA
jgi:allantoin racemase